MSKSVFNVSHSPTANLIYCSPDDITLYSVLETELMVISKGGDTVAFQFGLAAGGAFLGSLGNAIAACSQLSTTGKTDIPNHVALIIAVASLLIFVVSSVTKPSFCCCISRSHFQS